MDSEAEISSDNIEVYEETLDRDLYFLLLWEELKEQGFVWQDKYGNKYKAKTLAKNQRYLRNVIRYARGNNRPEEQISVLEKILEKSS